MRKKKTPESQLKQQIIGLFEYYRVWYLSMAPAFVKCPKCGNGFTRHGIRSGVPDILVCYKGNFYGIEAKAGRNDLSDEQKEQKKLIELASGKVIVARCPEDVIEGLELPGRLF